MSFWIVKNNQRGIAFKTALLSGKAVLTMLVINGMVFKHLESNLVDLIFGQYVSNVEQAIDNQGQIQKEALKKSVVHNTRMLGDASAAFLVNFDMSSLQRLLSAFMEEPNLMAVQVWDRYDEPIFAIWKNPEVDTGEQLPGNFAFDEKLSSGCECLAKG